METYEVKYGQTIFDVALQVYGDISGIGDLLKNNKTLNFGSVLSEGDKILYDANNAINSTVVKYFDKNNLTVSNGEGYIYFKETEETIRALVFIDQELMSINWQLSGTGTILFDWGDDTDIEAIPLSSAPKYITHSMNSLVSANYDFRKIRIYGNFTLTTFNAEGSGIEKLFAINEFSTEHIDLSNNSKCTNIGFASIAKDATTIKLSRIKVGDLLPLVSQEKMSNLWIDNATITQDTLDNYFIGLVKNYQSRPACNVRMWGNASPSGIYQKPDVLYDPQTGLEAMWVLENERGWSIQEIISPPKEESINRRLDSRVGANIIDSAGGQNALLCLPVSKFTSSQLSDVITNINAATINHIKLKVMIEALPVSRGTIIGALDDTNGSFFSVDILPDGRIEFSHGPAVFTTTASIHDGSDHLIEIDASSGEGMVCSIDEEVLSQLPPQGDNTNSFVSIGCLYSSSGTKTKHIDALVWDVELSFGNYKLPLPHLMYDVMTKTKYTANAVTERIISPIISGVPNNGGSEYMLLHGAIARRPNSLLTGYSEKIGDGTLNPFWSEANISVVKHASKKMLLTGLMKVTQAAKDMGASAVIRCEYFNAANVSLGSSELLSTSTSYSRHSTEILLPATTDYVTLTSHHNPDIITDGTAYVKEVSLTPVIPEFIPNSVDGEILIPLLTGDTPIPGGEFLNLTPLDIIFGEGASIQNYIWDKSRTDIWSNNVRSSECYDPADKTRWCMPELSQKFIYNNIETSFLYIPWIKVSGGKIEDIFQYPEPLTGDDKNRCNRYVHLTT